MSQSISMAIVCCNTDCTGKKPTQGITYLQRGSFHPPHVFDAVAYSNSQMMRVAKRNSVDSQADIDIQELPVTGRPIQVWLYWRRSCKAQEEVGGGTRRQQKESQRRQAQDYSCGGLLPRSEGTHIHVEEPRARHQSTTGRRN